MGEHPGEDAKPETFAVSVDVVILTVRAGTFSVLLVRRRRDPHAGAWALPGSRVRVGEGVRETARRALWQKTGMDIGPDDVHLEQLRSYGEPDRDARGRTLSVAYLVLLPDPPVALDRDDVRFWPARDLGGPASPPLAFDHGEIVLDARERASAKLEYTPLATAFVEEPFTLADLRHVYEAVWGVELDAANFRRKVVSATGFVEPSDARARPGPGGGRPARLYNRGQATLLHPPMLRPGTEP